MTELSQWFSIVFDNLKVDIISSISFLMKPTIPFGLKPDRTCTPVSATSIRWEVYWRQWMRRTWWVTRCQTVMMSAWSNLCQNMPKKYRNMPIHFSWPLFHTLSLSKLWSDEVLMKALVKLQRLEEAQDSLTEMRQKHVQPLLGFGFERTVMHKWVKWLWCHSKSWNAHVLNVQRLCQGIWSLTPLC